jgi:hypothetical protein
MTPRNAMLFTGFMMAEHIGLQNVTNQPQQTLDFPGEALDTQPKYGKHNQVWWITNQ